MKKLKLLAVLMAIIMTTNVHAALQSRPGVDAKKRTTASNFFKLMREMESAGGSFGLNATFAENATSGEYEETSESNNIDTHMCKNTEWGTVAMLSASDYGAGNGKVSSSYNYTTKTYGVTASTTGNMSGVFGMLSGAAGDEYVAGGILSKMSSSYNKYLINAHSRYVDSYADGSSSSDFTRYIPGDATYETKTFTGGGGSFVYSSRPIFNRGYAGVFYSDYLDGCDSQFHGSRVAVWVGAGL